MHRRRAHGLASLLATALWLFGALPAHAEGFVDVRIGIAASENDDIDVRSHSGGVNFVISDRVEYDVGPSLGIRGGYWFTGDANWLGLGAELSYFHAFEDRTRGELDIYAFPLSPLLFLRVPIDPSERYPGGRVQPYAAVGPAITLSLARLATEDLVVGLDDFYDSRLDVGLDARGGIAVHVAEHVALFLEYRYTYLDLEYENEVDFDFGRDPDIDVDTILRTHHASVGVSFRF